MENEGPGSVTAQGLAGHPVPTSSLDGMLRMPTPAEALDTALPMENAGESTGTSIESTAAYQPPMAGDDAAVVFTDRRQSLRRLLIRGGFIALAVLILASLLFIFIRRSNRSAPVRSGSFSNTHLPLGQIVKTVPITAASSPTITINGQLRVSNSIVLTPTSAPAAPTTGQLYFDKNSNQVTVYNGTQFQTLGGSTGNSSIQNTTNVTNIIGAGGGVLAAGGTANTIAKFTGGQTLGPSIISDNGSSVSITGNLNLVTVATTTPADLEIWPADPTPTNADELGDHNAVELGVKFHTDVSGFIKGIRFYKGPTNTGTHTGHLWTSTGTLLASVTFTSESATGWQEVNFGAPVAISADTTYVASYHTDVGQYAHDDGFFSSGGVDNDSLHALADGVDGANGVFKYSAGPIFPTNGFDGINYWVDVVFTPNPPPAKFQVNGVQISSADLSNSADIAKRTASQVFSGTNTFRANADSTNSFSIQNSNGTPLLVADTADSQLFVGPAAGNNAGVILVLGNRLIAGDPAGAEGAMYYNRSSFSFRCYRDAVWQPCGELNVDHNFSLYDEFMGGQTSLASPISTLGWTAQAIGANGAVSYNPATPAPVADRPGVLDLQTPATSNQGTTLTLANGNAGSMLIETGNDLVTAVAVSSASNQVVRIGLHPETTATTQPLSGAWWEANPAVDSHWRYCYGDGTTATCAISNVDILANTWVRLEIRITATGNGTSAASFYANGNFFNVQAVTIDTTNRLSPALTCYATTNAAQHCYWDYFQLFGATNDFR